jgi:hypothetical protein
MLHIDCLRYSLRFRSFVVVRVILSVSGIMPYRVVGMAHIGASWNDCPRVVLEDAPAAQAN